MCEWIDAALAYLKSALSFLSEYDTTVIAALTLVFAIFMAYEKYQAVFAKAKLNVATGAFKTLGEKKEIHTPHGVEIYSSVFVVYIENMSRRTITISDVSIKNDKDELIQRALEVPLILTSRGIARVTIPADTAMAISLIGEKQVI